MGRGRQMAAMTLLGLVAGAGLIPLLNTGGETATPEGVVAAASATPAGSTVAVDATVPPAVPGLDPEVVRVLAGHGYAQQLSIEALEEQLDPVVVRVLIEAGVALPVLEPAAAG